MLNQVLEVNWRILQLNNQAFLAFSALVSVLSQQQEQQQQQQEQQQQQQQQLWPVYDLRSRR